MLGEGECQLTVCISRDVFTELDLRTNLMRKGQGCFIHLAGIPGLALLDVSE